MQIVLSDSFHWRRWNICLALNLSLGIRNVILAQDEIANFVDFIDMAYSAPATWAVGRSSINFSVVINLTDQFLQAISNDQRLFRNSILSFCSCIQLGRLQSISISCLSSVFRRKRHSYLYWRKEVMLLGMSVCLSLCLSATVFKSYERILNEFFGGIGCGPRTTWLDFGGDADHHPDTEISNIFPLFLRLFIVAFSPSPPRSSR